MRATTLCISVPALAAPAKASGVFYTAVVVSQFVGLAQAGTGERRGHE